MTISEMHSMFRTIGQMKGMQNIRGILPEEIDDYLNAAIIGFCREVLASGSATQYPDKVSQRDNQIVPYNALRTLYDETPKQVGRTLINEHYTLNLTKAGTEYLAIIGADVNYSANGRRYQCRIVEPTKIGYLLNDYCNRPTKTEPFCVIDSDVSQKAEFHIYTDKNVPYQCFVHTINMPKVVSEANKVDCDLPAYVHQEIVERAVQKFFTSVGATTHQVKQ
jgi:hypothetical protein